MAKADIHEIIERDTVEMANSEDVLERADAAQKMIPRAIDVFEQAVFIGSVVDDLAAEVRELRRDRARLERVLRREDDAVEIRISFRDHHVARTIPCREYTQARDLLALSEFVTKDLVMTLGTALDAAMAGGEERTDGE